MSVYPALPRAQARNASHRPHLRSAAALAQPAGFTVRRGSTCPACGREVGLLEERHVVDGRPFHTVCVPR